MPKKQPNFRKALAQMLEYIGAHCLEVGGANFVLSTDVMLKNPLIVKTLEEAGCLQRLGRLNGATQAIYNRAYAPHFIRQLYDKALTVYPKMKCPWGHWVWEVVVIRFDQVNPQLLLSRPLLEEVERLYGKDTQVRAVDEEDRPTDEKPWRAEP